MIPSAPAQDTDFKVLSVTIKDQSVLYSCYMPFLKNGGLFIPTKSHHQIYDEVLLLLDLLQEDKKLAVVGKVA